MKINKLYTLALLVIVVILSISLLNKKPLPQDSQTGSADIGGSFTLTDQHGKQRTDKEFLGKPTFVFFGFTRCPMICPTTTATLASALKQLKGDADDVNVLFISIDPKHDTPEAMREYLSNFDKRIVGLTGTEKQVEEVASAYKTYYAEQGDTMDHSTFIYLMDENGKYISHFPYTAPASDLATAVLELL